MVQSTKKKLPPISSFCYLGDPIDFYKRDMFRSLSQFKNKVLLKKVALVKDRNTYERHLKTFFGESIEAKFYDNDYSLGKAQYLFIDPPNGLIDKKNITKNHLSYQEVDQLLTENPVLEAVSIYQHFNREIRTDFDFKIPNTYLPQITSNEAFKYAFILRFKDFYIVNLSKDKSFGSIFSYQKCLSKESNSERQSMRYLEYKRSNKKWEKVKL